MTVTFPAIRPAVRRLVPGTLPQSKTRTVNGRTVRRPLASSGGGMRLEVEFPNRPDFEAEAIRQLRNAAQNEPVILPPEIWAGDPGLEAFVAFLPPGTAWRFSGDVEVEWAKRGRATIKVAFANFRRTVLTLPPTPEIEVPPTPPLVYQFQVSETTTLNAVMASSGRDGFCWSQSIITTAGSIYWTGYATVLGNTRYFLMKYDSELNQLWAKWLEGTAGRFSNPVICEGPTDGVFMATAGGTNVLARFHLFTSEGALVSSAAYDFTGTYIQGGANEHPNSLLYVASENKLYAATSMANIVVLRALTLDNASGRSSYTAGQPQPSMCAVFWLADKQRVVMVGELAEGNVGGPGGFVREFSPDLATVYQAYRYTADRTYYNFAIDTFGGIYLGSMPVSSTVTPSPRNFFLTRLSGSDGGYATVWTRSFNPIPAGSAPFYDGAGARMQFLPDGRLVIQARRPSGRVGIVGAYDHKFILQDDLTAIESRTSQLWYEGSIQTIDNPGTGPFLGGNFLDTTKQLATFVAGPFSIGLTSLFLPVGASLPLASTTAGGASPNMTGNTSSLSIPLTTVTPLPARTAWATPMGVMVASGAVESGWSTSDLTATVNHVTKSTGPLFSLPPTVTKPPLIDLRFEGPEGSTNVTDSSTYNRAVSLTPNARITTATAYPGSTSSLRSTVDGYANCGDLPDWTVGTQDFEIALDFNIRNGGSDGGLLSIGNPTTNTGAPPLLALRWLNYDLILEGTGLTYNIWTYDTWYRLRVARIQGEFKMMIDGATVAAASSSLINFTGGTMRVGIWGTNSFNGFGGYIDNFAFTVGGILQPW